MRWRGRRQSQNVEDRRGTSAGRGFGRRMPARRMSVGGGIVGLIAVVAFLLLGGDPAVLLQQAPQGGRPQAVPQRDASGRRADDTLAEFVGVVLADTEDVWSQLFTTQVGRDYEEADLVLFEGQVESACGFATAAVGPFYCPADSKIYLDLQFFQQLSRQLGAPGDFAMAYVVAHEVAHHVQNLLGLSSQVQRMRQRSSEVEANRMSVRLELQADYLSGVWARHADRMYQILEEGDLEEAMNAASAIGDDRLQKSGQGYVVPDSFTHGTSAQRLRWFRRGYETGDVGGMNQLFELPYDQL